MERYEGSSILHERFDWYSKKWYFIYSTNESDSEEAISCVGGLEYVERWDDDYRNIRRVLLCPVFIALYNMFINGIDCMDQVLDLSLSNAYALYLFCMEITKFIGPN